ncbi:hypothetical protein N7522_006161 [Penicillium canescens]|nr:hypothetical protein N7522_006161 [Penicillium canescens]
MADDILREEGLPDTTPRYQYQGVKQCLRCFELELERYDRDGQHGDCLFVIFDHVDDRSFQECFEDVLKHSWETYNFISHTIVLKMTTSDVHEAAHRAFSEIFSAWHRGQESRLIPTGGATVKGFTRKKHPDSSWKTSVHIPGRDMKWPTILVEAGWSKPMAKLKQDVLFWLRESEQQVKVALTIQVTRRGSITIQQWVLDQTARRSSVKPIQTMHITRNRNAHSNQHQVSGSMRIQFEDCFLRAKRGNESDFSLSNDDLTEIAEAVWCCLPE